jgi:hypothetical protein
MRSRERGEDLVQVGNLTGRRIGEAMSAAALDRFASMVQAYSLIVMLSNDRLYRLRTSHSSFPPH